MNKYLTVRNAAVAGVTAILAAAAAVAFGAEAQDPNLPQSTTTTQQARPPVPTAPATPADTIREGPTDLPPAPGTGSSPLAATPLARAFASGWINLTSDPDQLEQTRQRLVALSTGTLARRVDLELTRRIDAGGLEAGSEGDVIATSEIGRSASLVEVLVTTRERLTSSGTEAEPFHYALYLARLTPAGSGRYLVSDWEPQI